MSWMNSHSLPQALGVNPRPDEVGQQQNSSGEHYDDVTILQKAQEQWRSLFMRPEQILRPAVLSVENRRQNSFWGDPMEAKEESHTRVYAMNVNGLTLDRRGGQYTTVCAVQKEIQADVFCGSEHNLDTTQSQVRSVLYDTISQYWDRNRLVFGTSPIPFKSSYKPGGTFVQTVGNLTGRVVHQSADKWGRWATQELQGRQGQKLIICSVYQVVDKLITPGQITAAAQQHSLLLRTQDKITQPRVAFQRDLLHFIREHRLAGHELLIVGDFNEALGSVKMGMSHIASTMDLIDLMGSKHSAPPPATFARGSKRIDYAMGSHRVANALRRCGYDAFNERLTSDHRGYYLDFATDLLFGADTPGLSVRASRALNSSNTNQVTEYIKRKHALLMQHNVFERARKLQHPGPRHAYAERIDKDVVAASLSAEKNLRRFAEPEWSVELSQARRLVIMFSKLLSAYRTGLDHNSIIQNDVQYLPGSFVPPLDQTECSQRLREAQRRVKELVAKSYETRDQERERRIHDLEISALKADKQQAQRLRRFKKAEDLKQLFRKLRFVRNAAIKRGVTRLEIPIHPEEDPKKCTEWQQIDVPSDILAHLQQRNRSHFGQAQGTPFTVPPLMTHLGYCGDGPFSNQVLRGEYDSSALDENVQLLLSHLEHVQEMLQCPSRPTITESEFIGKLKVWTESTTTSPSGLHLGHYKSLIARHAYSTDASDEDLSEAFKQQRDELNRMQADLLQLHLTLVNYALERGYSYRRWQKIANTILFKDPDNVRIHRTRVIHIYEADFNLALGIKWRLAMQQAEDFEVLNDGQYGSRSHRNAVDPVFMEELQYDISRTTRWPMVLTSYDAMSCYDRIIPKPGYVGQSKIRSPTICHSSKCLNTSKGTVPHPYRFRFG